VGTKNKEETPTNGAAGIISIWK